ncbi:MAG TPA: mechanosensitive ion channel domain-containing protein [Ktedonobacteraceae bacterium]|nr:mechanosensitive ion channel domain-containing protein [Ktedonobacteraceae bacterium]
MSPDTRIFLTIIDILVALIIGFILRRRVVEGLRNSILDKWLIQTLGLLVIVPLLLLAVAITPIIWDNSILFTAWDNFKKQFNITSVNQLVVNILGSLFILAIGIGVARTLMQLAIRGLSQHVDINIRTLIGRISYVIVLAFAVLCILSIWNISIGVPVAALGLITVGLTVALQNILKDLVSGFYILVERPFHIGDLITVTDVVSASGRTGRVEDVQLRTTRLRLTSGELASVPNSLIFGGVVINSSFFPDRRATLTVTLPQEMFVKDETPPRISGALQEIEAIMPKPEPIVRISSASAGKITLIVRFWVANGHTETDLSIVSDAICALLSILPGADITVIEPSATIS